MIRVNEKWYECECGHITVGEGEETKCKAEAYMLHYIKGKRRSSWSGEVTKADKKCGKPIVKSGDIPETLDYFNVWEFETMHAFLMQQKFDAHFLICLQEAFAHLERKIDGLKKKD